MPKKPSMGSPRKVNSVSTPSTVNAAMRAAEWLCAERVAVGGDEGKSE